jgi:biotin transport system substrate-specific component
VAASALGWRRVFAALALYAVAGVCELPRFSGHASDDVGVSVGYVVGLALSVVVCGYVSECAAARLILRSVPAMVAGEIAMYAVGVTGLAFSLRVGASKAIALGSTRLLADEAIKAATAARPLPAAWKLVGPSSR